MIPTIQGDEMKTCTCTDSFTRNGVCTRCGWPVGTVGNAFIDAALADPTNPIKTAGQCCAHAPGHKCACVCGKGRDSDEKR